MTVGLRIDTSPERAEFVSDRLWALGATAVSEEWRSDGVVVLRTSLGDDRELVAAAMRRELPGEVWVEEEIDLAVADTWKAHVTTTSITDDLFVRPAWIDEPRPERGTVVSIDPGPTFGLGDHPTTRGSLQILSDIVGRGSSILDVGCGSGVLGITGLLLGAERAVGVDITPAAIEISRRNAEVNRVSDRWSVSLDPLEFFGEPFDVVLANILAPTIVQLSVQLRRLTGRFLVISGVLDGHDSHVLAALRPLREVRRVVIDGWATTLLEAG